MSENSRTGRKAPYKKNKTKKLLMPLFNVYDIKQNDTSIEMM